MPTKLIVSNILIEEGETVNDVSERIKHHLSYYSKRHPEFSFSIEELIDSNELIVKTVTLENNVN